MEKMKLARQCLSAQLEPATLDEHRRTIDVQFYSGANVERMDFWTGERFYLAFSTKPEHVRLGRLNSGAPVLDSHAGFRVGNVLGVIERAWLEGGTGKATLRFSERPDVEPLWTDIKNGIVRNVSMGASIRKLEDVTPKDSKQKHLLAVDWEPLEISAIPIPADAGAQFLQQQTNEQLYTEVEIVPTTRKESIMQTNTAINNPDGEAIQKAVRLANSNLGANLDEAFCQRLVDNGTTLADARTEIFNKLAEQSETNPIRTAHAQVTRDGGQTEITGLQNLMLHRFNATKYPFPSGQFDRMLSLLEVTRRDLEIRGHRTQGKRDSEVAQLAFQTTSDHPNLFTATGARRLADSYAENQSPIKELFRISDAKDFRPKSVIKFQGVSDLLELNEHGEILHAPVHDEAETYTPKQYARQTAFTDQALRNDDLDALLRLPDEFGKASARKEADEAVRLLQLNAGLGPVMSDGLNLFDAGHGNLAGSGGAISEATITAGLLAIRLQKNLDGTSTLGLVPKFLLAPATKEVLARKQVAVVYPPTVDDVNPHTSALTVLAESRLDAASTIAWYLAVSPSSAAVFEIAFLDGARGPRIETRAGWDILGLQMRCVHEFGLGVIDWRGIYRNPGA